MQIEPYSILIILILTMGLFLWGKWRYDVVAMVSLSISVAVGAVPLRSVYSGFSHPAVITVACVMVLSAAITESGVLNRLVRKLPTNNMPISLHILTLSTLTAILSAFMNNVGALALMMPIAIQTANQAKRPPSLLLMPIALASALGGLTTLIGTPPNLLISQYRAEYLGTPFHLFDFSPVGLPVAALGIVAIAFMLWRLIPRGRRSSTRQEDLFQIKHYISEVTLPEGSPLVGASVRDIEKQLGEDFFILGLIRDHTKRLVVRPKQQCLTGDILMIEGPAEKLESVLADSGLEMATEQTGAEELESDEIAVVEAVVPQGSRVEGRSSKSIRLRSRHHINLLAISRQGKSVHDRLSQIDFKPGDVVLLQGNRELMPEKIASLGFLPLVERGIRVGSTLSLKTFLPMIFFMIAILIAGIGFLPVEVAFGGGILAMLLTQVISIRRVYQSIDWSIIVLLGAMIPIGTALQSTGGTGLLAHYFLMVSDGGSPTLVLALLLIATMTLSDFMNNAATTVVMAPIAVSIAKALNVHIDPFLMSVALGASCSFLTPVGHQNNTLVMGPGGYRFFDYIRLGLPLEILVVSVAMPMILWAWPIS